MTLKVGLLPMETTFFVLQHVQTGTRLDFFSNIFQTKIKSGILTTFTYCNVMARAAFKLHSFARHLLQG